MNKSELMSAVKAAEIIKNNQHFVILSHYNPDGDAIGSSLAINFLLAKIGKKATVIVPNEYPDFLKWMSGSNEIIIYQKKRKVAKDIVSRAEVIFFLDFNSPERLGEMDKLISGFTGLKVLIDHHPDPANFSDLIISDTLASSTAELVYRFIELTGMVHLIDKDIASAIYAGIMSDTGSFNFNSSQPETYRIVSELLKIGVDKDSIFSLVYDNFSEHRMKLLGHCLNSNMVVLPKYKTAYITLSKNDIKEYKYKRGDSEGFVNYPLSIKGVEFSAFFMENDDHIKISFRSKGSFDTNQFARNYFDGGGHKNASGGSSKLTLTEVVSLFETVVPEAMTKNTEN